MKKLNSLIILALLIVSFSANAVEVFGKKHFLYTQERTIGSFRGIASGGPLTVKVTMGNSESIRMEGDQEAIAELITEVKEGILTIRPQTKWSEWSRRFKKPNITVYISAKKITSLTMSGSGSIDVENTISSSDLTATLSGSGGITANASLKSFTGVISGSGTLKMSGKAEDSNLTLSGSGSFTGKSFAVSDLSVQISGSANVYIKASKHIDAVISGSGNIYYSGDAVVKKTVIGSGSITKL